MRSRCRAIRRAVTGVAWACAEHSFRDLFVSVQLAERPSRGRRHVASHGPATAKRQMVDQPVAACEAAKKTPAEPAREPVERRPAREPRPQLERRAFVERPLVVAKLALAELTLQIRQ